VERDLFWWTMAGQDVPPLFTSDADRDEDVDGAVAHTRRCRARLECLAGQAAAFTDQFVSTAIEN
jgi:hypothetical protein